MPPVETERSSTGVFGALRSARARTGVKAIGKAMVLLVVVVCMRWQRRWRISTHQSSEVEPVLRGSPDVCRDGARRPR